MSDIQKKLDSLQPYINGIRYVNGVQVVDAVFKKGWIIPNSDIIKKELINSDANAFVFYTEEKGITFDDLLDYVENIIGINIERENKQELLKLKVKELQEIFKENTLSKLETLQFTFGQPEIDILTNIDDIDLTLEETKVEDKTPVEEPNNLDSKEIETVNNETVETTNNNVINTKIKGQKIELPPKKNKIELEEFKEPKNIVCKCGEDDICPICEDEKLN